MLVAGERAPGLCHPQNCYNEWLERENGVDGIKASKAALDRAIECHFICSDGANSIFACQPLTVAVSKIALKRSTHSKQKQHKSHRALPMWFQMVSHLRGFSPTLGMEENKSGKRREPSRCFCRTPDGM